jgi:hypothetical protein
MWGRLPEDLSQSLTLLSMSWDRHRGLSLGLGKTSRISGDCATTRVVSGLNGNHGEIPDGPSIVYGCR